MQQKLQVKVEEMMDEFSKQWQPVMENLEVADQAFDDVEGPPQFQASAQTPARRASELQFRANLTANSQSLWCRPRHRASSRTYLC